jgi:hypothetical protein
MSILASIEIQDFENSLMNCLRDEINRVVAFSCIPIKYALKPIVKIAIESTLEYQSLCSNGGLLRKNLGLEYPAFDMDKIIELIQENMEVKPVKVTVRGIQLVGGLQVGILRTGYGDILGLPDSFYDSNGHKIEWLNWLLTKGDGIIVSGYRYRDASGRGRAGSRAGGLMYKGGAWRVPPQFSGTARNNFLTRAFDVPYIQQEIGLVIENELSKRF